MYLYWSVCLFNIISLKVFVNATRVLDTWPSSPCVDSSDGPGLQPMGNPWSQQPNSWQSSCTSPCFHASIHKNHNHFLKHNTYPSSSKKHAPYLNVYMINQYVNFQPPISIDHVHGAYSCCIIYLDTIIYYCFWFIHFIIHNSHISLYIFSINKVHNFTYSQ